MDTFTLLLSKSYFCGINSGNFEAIFYEAGHFRSWTQVAEIYCDWGMAHAEQGFEPLTPGRNYRCYAAWAYQERRSRLR
jgi:hypothetical protein